MHRYQHGDVAIEASVEREGNLYVAKVFILEEDGESTSLGTFGYFASSDAAYSFAMRCGVAFVEGEALPRPPCQTLSPR
ncbi:hypothetical protein [Caballeronia sp. S22]|uniref:hypothetical protein n=1 Tax=Caballeronia sp. S22 TaxID=3137182 RepID=UPI003530F254